MRRGEVWWASLPGPLGSGPGFRRPVLVVQSDSFNRSQIATVVVAVITTNLSLSDAPGNVRLNRSDSGLPKTSVVNVSQLLTVDREFLTECVHTLGVQTLRLVDDGLRRALSL